MEEGGGPKTAEEAWDRGTKAGKEVVKDLAKKVKVAKALPWIGAGVGAGTAIGGYYLLNKNKKK